MGELPQVDVDAVLAHTKVLSSDQFEGRAPGGKGEQLTVGYLVDQFEDWRSPATPTAQAQKRRL